MKLMRLAALAMCAQIPHAIAFESISLELPAATYISQFNALSNKGVYVIVGVFAALCSCLIAKKGIESACEKENRMQGTLLAAVGLLGIAASLKLATGT